MGHGVGHTREDTDLALRRYSTVIDCHDPAALARWWAETLDRQITDDDDDEVSLVPGWLDEDTAARMPWERTGPGLTFVPVPETRATTNRLHIDLAPHTDDDRDALIAALIAREAAPADVGQSDDATWTVLTDPEGNEFCVLSSRDSSARSVRVGDARPAGARFVRRIAGHTGLVPVGSPRRRGAAGARAT